MKRGRIAQSRERGPRPTNEKSQFHLVALQAKGLMCTACSVERYERRHGALKEGSAAGDPDFPLRTSPQS